MRLIVISGMHRSGTSAVARIVNLMGVDLGAEERLMGAKPDNPTGFWENLSFSSFNDDLLAYLGGRWDDPPVLLAGWEGDSGLDPWRDRALEVLDDQFSGEIGGWKDPRMSLLLPFWRTVVDIEPGLLVLRHPAEVAASLAARDAMAEDRSARLWLRYVVAARRNDPAALLVPYDDLFNDLDNTVDRFAAHLEIEAPAEATRITIASFLDGGLRHHDASGDPGSGRDVQLAALTYTAMTEGRDEALVAALSASVDAGLLLQIVGHLGDAVARLERHRDELLAERDVAVSQRDELARDKRERIEQHRVALATSEERLEIQSAQLGRLEATGERLGADLRAATRRVDEVEHALAQAESRIDELTRSPVARVKAWLAEMAP